MRKFLTMSLALVFFWAFLRAPFQHVHHHHSAIAHIGGLWHTHFHVTSAQRVSLEEPSPHHDSRLDWFNQDGSGVSAFCPNPVRAPETSTISAVACVVRTLTPRAHDPP